MSDDEMDKVEEWCRYVYKDGSGVCGRIRDAVRHEPFYAGGHAFVPPVEQPPTPAPTDLNERVERLEQASTQLTLYAEHLGIVERVTALEQCIAPAPAPSAKAEERCQVCGHRLETPFQRGSAENYHRVVAGHVFVPPAAAAVEPCPKCGQAAGRRFDWSYEVNKCPMDKPHASLARWCHFCDHWCRPNCSLFFCPDHRPVAAAVEPKPSAGETGKLDYRESVANGRESQAIGAIDPNWPPEPPAPEPGKDGLVDELRELGYSEPERTAASIERGLEQARRGEGRIMSIEEASSPLATDRPDGEKRRTVEVHYYGDRASHVKDQDGAWCDADEIVQMVEQRPGERLVPERTEAEAVTLLRRVMAAEDPDEYADDVAKWLEDYKRLLPDPEGEKT